MNDTVDERTRRQAVVFLNAESEMIDARTQAALTRARVQAAAHVADTRWKAWGGAGLGVALAASLSVLVVMPQPTAVAPDGAPIAEALAEQEIVLAGDDETAIADDMAFVAWLEENPDA